MNSDGSGKQVVVDGEQIQNKVDWGTHPSRDPPSGTTSLLPGTGY
jgi:hypothetical protein